MAVLFSRGQLVVTDEWVRVGGRQYRMPTLQDVRLTRAALRSTNVVWGLVTAVVVTSLLYWAAVAAWRQNYGALLAALGLGVLAGLGVLQGTRRRELWLDTSSGSALIWSGHDRIEANKALRAVRRAHEHHRTAQGDWG
jgi:hypothetical protein